ncbi:hypothetical protein EST38_g1470 [Candolleomyces aberdarensis]|uniref:FAD-binding FR-type domain-containing protein n=1 Tax=Candolleomyces aberdarensis TaxID=2316362 RepID=A0A4Q2DZ89_9AGAR|nr:hypothetical protein EST38_g1470 [Candolleomyces aberdarensis]
MPPPFDVQLIKSTTLLFRVNIFIYALIAFFVVLRMPGFIGLFGTSEEWSSGHFLRYIAPPRPQFKKSRSTLKRKGTKGSGKGGAGKMQRNDSTRTVVGDGREPKDEMEMIKDEEAVEQIYVRYPPRRHASTRKHYEEDEDYEGLSALQPYFPPTHVPSVPSSLRPLLSLSRLPLPFPPSSTRPYSLKQFCVVLSYCVILFYALMYRSNPFIDATRSGWVSTSQIPLVLGLGVKGNALGLGGLLGVGYERLNWGHRVVGRVVVFCANLHGVFYVYKWTATGTFTTAIARPKNVWGMILLIAINILWIFSTIGWRKGKGLGYRVFIWSHVLGAIVTIPAIYMHQPSLWLYALSSAGIWGLDRIIRMAKTRVAIAILTPSPLSTNPSPARSGTPARPGSCDVIHLTIPSLNTGWRAGQHVRLRVISPGVMGWFGSSEVHPFTIANAPVSSPSYPSASHHYSAPAGDEGLHLVIKKCGLWTGRLAELATSPHHSSYLSSTLEDGEEHLDTRTRVRVLIEGPYGGPGRLVFSSFSSVVLVCGGSGITFGLGMLSDLVKKDLAGECRVKSCELVWVVTGVKGGEVEGTIPRLVELAEVGRRQQRRRGGGGSRMEVKVNVFYTRAVTSQISLSGLLGRGDDEDEGEVDAKYYYRPIAIHPNVVISPGRPKLAKSLDYAITQACSLSHGSSGMESRMSDDFNRRHSNLNFMAGGPGPKGVAVGVCGPRELGEDVGRTVTGVDPARRERVGGIEIYEEVFGL